MAAILAKRRPRVKKNLKQQKNEASFPNGIDGTQLMKKTIAEYRKITEEKMKGKLSRGSSISGIRARSAVVGGSTRDASLKNGHKNAGSVGNAPVQLNYMKIQKLGNFR